MTLSKKQNQTSTPQIDSNAWMVTFGDLIMLLLTFFVLLLTMKSMDSNDLRELFQHISIAGGPLEFSESGLSGDASDFFGDNENAVYIENSNAFKQLYEIMKDIKTSLPEEKKIKAFQEAMKIEENPQGIVVTLQAEQLFEPGKVSTNPSKIYLLDTAGELLKMTTNDILIMGHTSKISKKVSPFESNWDLSFYRALQIFYYLVDSKNLQENRLAIGGFGDKMPKYSEGDTNTLLKNDRIEFILVKK